MAAQAQTGRLYDEGVDYEEQEGEEEAEADDAAGQDLEAPDEGTGYVTGVTSGEDDDGEYLPRGLNVDQLLEVSSDEWDFGGL